jgi:predicted dehydrogenase
MKTPIDSNPTRRQFLKTGSAAAAASVFALNFSVKERAFAQNADTLKVGLIGCGGRGTGAASQALRADSNVVLTAMADAFSDRLTSSLNSLKQDFADRVQVDEDHGFVGFDAYQKLIDSGVDVVLLATPPGFRPLHLKAAVDGPGIRKVMESAEEAKRRGLALVAGFCWRYNYGERAIVERILDGQIGDVTAVHTVYNTGSLWVKPRQPEWSDMQYQMRNWYYFTWLCGDHIVEQACHSLDKMSWILGDVPPVKAIALGGRQVRTGRDFGHIFDHFAVIYEYENGVRGFHNCRQQPGCASDNSDYIMGTRGTGYIQAFNNLIIRGENPWRFQGTRPNMYQVEHDELFASIRSGKPINNGWWMAQSSLLAVMGRMAAYTGQEVTWDGALNSDFDYAKWVMNQENSPGEPEYRWDLPLRVPDVAMPGITKAG